MPGRLLTAEPTKTSRRGRPPRKGVATGVQKGTRLQISLTISPSLLARVDGLAEAMGQTRAALINLAIYRLLSQEAPGDASEAASK